MKSNYRKIGDFIQLVDERNKDLKVTKLLGLSISKQFIPSVANIIGTNMANYKIIKKNQFACSTMQVRRDKKMPIALLQDFEEAIISQAYPVFEVVDETILNPEYLMMWFSRSEFDRHACFLAVGGVRGSLEWEDFLDMPIPVPSIEEQREIVAEYNTIVNRIKLNETLNQKLEDTAQALYKHWFVDFEFPNADGKPYKSSGGEMVYNEELDCEIPLGWEDGCLGDFVDYTSKRVGVMDLSLETYISTDNMLPDKKGIKIANKLPTVISVSKFEKGNILLSNIRPYLKKIWQASYAGGVSNDVLCLVPKTFNMSSYIYTVLEQDSFFEYVMQGAKGTKMPRGDKDWNMKYSIAKPSEGIVDLFSKVSDAMLKEKLLRTQEKSLLVNLSELILSKMSKVEPKTTLV
ncbi:restriction endonuclease subunit S [Winogradskyella eximia]|uniref:restriction endonuclease subunit S n=1 Tax=Winogradskyella eximia TaxID=262006 RepID=UPI0024900A37|nr:restriction endonuclease subunit S [Winogradskyella eximia]